jgi:hypothetical protein
MTTKDQIALAKLYMENNSEDVQQNSPTKIILSGKTVEFHKLDGNVIVADINNSSSSVYVDINSGEVIGIKISNPVDALVKNHPFYPDGKGNFVMKSDPQKIQQQMNNINISTIASHALKAAHYFDQEDGGVYDDFKTINQD